MYYYGNHMVLYSSVTLKYVNKTHDFRGDMIHEKNIE